MNLVVKMKKYRSRYVSLTICSVMIHPLWFQRRCLHHQFGPYCYLTKGHHLESHQNLAYRLNHTTHQISSLRCNFLNHLSKTYFDFLLDQSFPKGRHLCRHYLLFPPGDLRYSYNLDAHLQRFLDHSCLLTK